MRVGIDFHPYPDIKKIEERDGYVCLGEIEEILQDALRRLYLILESINEYSSESFKELYYGDIVPEIEKYIVGISATTHRIFRNFQK